MATPAHLSGPFSAFARAALLALALPWLGAACGGGPEQVAAAPAAGPEARTLLPPASPPGVRFSFHVTTRGPGRALPAYGTLTGRDRSGRFCHLDRQGRFLPCTVADNVIPRDGRTWCDYAIPLQDGQHLDLPAGVAIDSGRFYLSVGAPVLLRVDEASLGLVQPDPANPADPNRAIIYDWVELTLDRTGFHGNTTCVDQFGLPVALTVVDRGRPDRPLGPVGLTGARSALFAAYRAAVPPAFAALADPGDVRILAPAHGSFRAGGADQDYFRGYIDAMWRKYREEPLVLTPDEGTFTGQVDPQDRLVFRRPGDPAAYRIGRPTSAEVLLCNGPLAAGNGTEKVLGAQLAALLNRHGLEAPLAWRDPAGYYRREPSNHYARFWHEHGLEARAYGFAYDDVNDQSSSLFAPDPQEITLAFRWD